MVIAALARRCDHTQYSATSFSALSSDIVPSVAALNDQSITLCESPYIFHVIGFI